MRIFKQNVYLIITTCFILVCITLPQVGHAAALIKAPSNLGLVGYWNMDSNSISGTSLKDNSGNGNTGTLVNTPTPVAGKLGQALSFNGSSQYVSAGTMGSFGSGLASSPSSYSMWVKTSNTSEINPMGTVNTGTHTVLDTYINSDSNDRLHTGWIAAYFRGEDGLEFDGNVASNTGVTDGNWHHIVWVVNFSTHNIKIYVDGVSQTIVQYYSSTPSSTANFSFPLFLGAFNNRGTPVKFFSGSLDDVRIYNRALSAAEVAALYQSGATTVNHSNLGVSNGLVGYWTMDGSSISGTSMTDASGHGNTATLVNAPKPAQGKIGQALVFNGNTVNSGTSTYLSVLNNSSLQVEGGDLTFSMWINPTTFGPTDRALLSKGDGFTSGYYLDFYGNGDILWIGIGGSEGPVDLSPTFTTGNWQHLVVERTGTTINVYRNTVLVGTRTLTGTTLSTNDLKIGVYYGNGALVNFKGNMDDVRIYNRALSAAEVAQLYNAGAPAKVNAPNNNKLTNGLVGLWSFDGPDLSGTTAYDRSGSGNDGTLVNAPKPVQGKIGQALKFDGSSQAVYKGGLTLPIPVTISAWINPNSSSGCIACFGWNPGNGVFSDFQLKGTNQLEFYQITSASVVDAVTPANSFTLNHWHHVVMTWNGTPGSCPSMYADGIAMSVSGCGGGTASYGTNLGIGRIANDASGYFNGSIDDVRIYNRELSASEVIQLYNIGR